MDVVIIGLYGISITNLILVAFYGGKLVQKVDGHEKRISKIEDKCFPVGPIHATCPEDKE